MPGGGFQRVVQQIEEKQVRISAESMAKIKADSDAQLARMQEPGVAEAMIRAFNATPEELGRASVEAAIAKHKGHGSGTAEDGPDDPDCPCRTTVMRGACAKAGCGFCGATT